MKLTDKNLKNLKPGDSRHIVWEENDFGLGTLGVRVSTKGRRTWIFMYRFEGKPRMYTLGVYPQMSVADAHSAHGNAQQTLERGEDPARAVLEERAAVRTAPTVKDVVETYIEEWAKKRKKSWKTDESILKRTVLPKWGDRPAIEISRADVTALLDGIVERGTPVRANRIRAVLSKMFNFARTRDLVTSNPVEGTTPPAKEQQRDRVLSNHEIRHLFAKLSSAEMAEPMKLQLQFLLLSAQRCGEVGAMEWSEVDYETGWWTVPEERAKNGVSHRVPLTPQLRTILDQAKAANWHERFVFPSHKNGPSTSQIVSQVLKKNRDLLCPKPQGGFLEGDKKWYWTAHDLRRTAASNIAGMGFNRLVVSKILNHAEAGVTSIYDRYSYDNEKREALEAWGTRVGEIVASRS